MVAPTVTSVSPGTGSTLGGTLVNVFGSGFQASAPNVYFGTAGGSSIMVESDTFLSVVSPPNASDVTVNITVQTINGTSATSSANQFVYAFPLPDAANYTNECPYFDLYANYTVYGKWTFAMAPDIPGGGPAWLLGGNNNSAPFPTNYIGTSDSVPVSIAVGGDEIVLFGTDLSVSIVTDTAPVLISSLSFSATTSGNISLSAAGQITLPILKTGTTADQLYYNSSNGDISWGALPAPSGGGWNWFPVTTTTALVAGNAYVNVNNASQISYTLPATAAFGDAYLVSGFGAGNWQIAPTGSQVVLLGGSSVASGHTLTSVSGTAVAALIVCVVANTTFMIYSASGSINIV